MTEYPLESYNLTTREVADKLGYKENHVRLLAAKGKLPAKKRFRQWLFSEEELEEFFANQTTEALSHAASDADASDILS